MRKLQLSQTLHIYEYIYGFIHTHTHTHTHTYICINFYHIIVKHEIEIIMLKIKHL